MAKAAAPSAPSENKNVEVPAVCLKWESLHLKVVEGSSLQNVSGSVSFQSIVLLVSDPCSSSQLLLHVLANQISAELGEVLCDSRIGIHETTHVWKYSDPATLFKLNVKDSIATHIVRCLPKSATDSEQRLLVGQTLLPMVSRKDTITSKLTRSDAKYLTLLQALSVPHKLIILEEPFEGLRYNEVLSILGILHHLKLKGHAIVVSSSVHPELLLRHVDVVYVFNRQGFVTYSGNPRELLKSIDQTNKCRHLDHVTAVCRPAQRPQGQKPPGAASRQSTEDNNFRDIDAPNNHEEAGNVFREIIFKISTDDNSILTYRVLSNVIFIVLTVLLSKKRSELSDHEKPQYNMNLYFVFHLFLSIQSFYFGYQLTIKVCSVVKYEYFNCHYLLGTSAICALTSIHTMIEVLCTVAFSVFIFLVTDQQQLYMSNSWNSALDRQAMSAWSPFLFTVTALLNSFNFGRLGFLSGILRINRSRFSNCSFCLGMIFMVVSIVPCRFHEAHEVSKNNGIWKAVAFLSPMSRLQDLTFYSVYGTRHDIFCTTVDNKQHERNATQPSAEQRNCYPFYSLVDGNSESILLLPIWTCLASILLVAMVFLRIYGTIVFAMALYRPTINESHASSKDTYTSSSLASRKNSRLRSMKSTESIA